MADRLAGPGVLQVTEHVLRAPGNGEMRIKIDAGNAKQSNWNSLL